MNHQPAGGGCPDGVARCDTHPPDCFTADEAGNSRWQHPDGRLPPLPVHAGFVPVTSYSNSALLEFRLRMVSTLTSE